MAVETDGPIRHLPLGITKAEEVLSTAAGVRDARNMGVAGTEAVRRAPVVLARAERELTRTRRAAEEFAEYAAHVESEDHMSAAALLYSRAAALREAIAELRREMELSGLIREAR